MQKTFCFKDCVMQKKCPICKQGVHCENNEVGAVIYHMDCLMEAMKEVREKNVQQSRDSESRNDAT